MFLQADFGEELCSKISKQGCLFFSLLAVGMRLGKGHSISKDSQLVVLKNTSYGSCVQ